MSAYPNLSPLQLLRSRHALSLPPILDNLQHVQIFVKDEHSLTLTKDIQTLFPQTSLQEVLLFKKGELNSCHALKVGVLFSGGQASGGHNVISGLLDALLKLNKDSQLIGFLDGPNGLITNKYKHLSLEEISSFRNQGGFHLLGSGRTKIETPEQFQAVEKTVRALKLDGLVIIGGDDSNTNAAFLAEYFKEKDLPVSVIGVPKTIDGDLKNEFVEVSFGYDTACKVYAEIIGNLAIDALSAKKYYFFVKMMGRSASHVTLECALKTHINLALIGEEIAALNLTLQQVVDQIADMICLRASYDKNYGVILIPEGIIEFIAEFKVLIQELNPLQAQLNGDDEYKMQVIKRALSKDSAACLEKLPESFQQQLLLERDPHGNIQVSKIETDRLLIALVQSELLKRKQMGTYKGEFSPQPLFCGYEGRCSLPSNFDSHYCYTLGHLAAVLVNSKQTGYMACIKHLNKPLTEWEMVGVPLVKMLHLEIRKGKRVAVIEKGLVNLEGEMFKFYCQKRSQWLVEDDYWSPGPIQYAGIESLGEEPPLILNF